MSGSRRKALAHDLITLWGRAPTKGELRARKHNHKHRRRYAL